MHTTTASSRVAAVLKKRNRKIEKRGSRKQCKRTVGSHRAGGGGDRTDDDHRDVTGTEGTAGVSELAAAETVLAAETLGAESSFVTVGTNVLAAQITQMRAGTIGEVGSFGAAGATV